MVYKLLGILVWKGAKLFLRRRYGAAKVPKAVLGGGLALVTVGALLAARGRLPGA
jgi:hypothetical protein